MLTDEQRDMLCAGLRSFRITSNQNELGMAIYTLILDHLNRDGDERAEAKKQPAPSSPTR